MHASGVPSFDSRQDEETTERDEEKRMNAYGNQATPSKYVIGVCALATACTAFCLANATFVLKVS